MERNQFALGRVISADIKEEKQKLVECAGKHKKKRTYIPFVKKKLWRILPAHNEKTRGLAFGLDTCPGDTYIQKKIAIEKQIQNILQPFLFVKKYQRKESTKHQLLAYYYTLRHYLNENQKIRWIFKRFFTKLRIRHLRKVNTTDPITLLPFQQAVYLNNFNSCAQYIFEADSLARHIHKNLLHHDGQIPYSRIPRNPYTNEVLTYLQLLSLITQCQKYGCTSWSIEAFIEHKLSIEQFSKSYYKPLRLHALKDTLKNSKDVDTIDTLYDFIKSQHEEHSKLFIRSIYLWAIEEAFEESRIQSWKKYCIQWYETDILEEDEHTKRRKLSTLSEKTKDLCEYPKELMEKKKVTQSNERSRGGL